MDCFKSITSSNANAVSYGTGTLPTPRVATVQEVVNNLEAWESTLVQIADIGFTDGGTYNGTKVLEDATGQIEMFTRSAASFANNTVPDDEFTIIAIVSQFNNPQLTIRNLNDIVQ
ncbi:MAG: DUF5689 domain-containing protein [Saprospiraceae bacterium]